MSLYKPPNPRDKANLTISPPAQFVSGAIAASNSFSNWLTVYPGKVICATCGTWVATVTIQMSPDGSEVFDIYTMTSNETKIIESPCSLYFRVGVYTGNYTSGSFCYRLMQGW
jgi:hypothetical protein